MADRYWIGIYDRAGQYGSMVATDYRDMARIVRDALKARYPDKTVEVFDGERDGACIDVDEALADEEEITHG